MPRNVACAHIPLFLTILTKAVKMTRMNVIFGIGHIYILSGRIHGNAVGYLNLLIGPSVIKLRVITSILFTSITA